MGWNMWEEYYKQLFITKCAGSWNRYCIVILIHGMCITLNLNQFISCCFVVSLYPLPLPPFSFSLLSDISVSLDFD